MQASLQNNDYECCSHFLISHYTELNDYIIDQYKYEMDFFFQGELSDPVYS